MFMTGTTLTTDIAQTDRHGQEQNIYFEESLKVSSKCSNHFDKLTNMVKQIRKSYSAVTESLTLV